LEFVNGVGEDCLGAELLDQLKGRPHGIEGRDLQDAGIVKIDHALVLIFFQQRFQHGAGLGTVLGKDIALKKVLHALPPGERWLIKRHVANEVKGVKVLAHLIGQRLKGQPFTREFIDNGLLTVRIDICGRQ